LKTNKFVKTTELFIYLKNLHEKGSLKRV